MQVLQGKLKNMTSQQTFGKTKNFNFLQTFVCQEDQQLSYFNLSSHY